MCFALFIAAGSFFSIRERAATILPEPFTTAPMRALPILLVFGAMFYWPVAGPRPFAAQASGLTARSSTHSSMSRSAGRSPAEYSDGDREIWSAQVR